MLTVNEIEEIKSKLSESEISRDSVMKLIAEVERLRGFVTDYSHSVTAQIGAIEDNMELLENENSRLLIAKNTALIERDACIGLLAQFAKRSGVQVGVTAFNQVVIDLPSGQVSWEFNESEGHLFKDLPIYDAIIEDMPIEEKYRRVMNSGFDIE